MDSLTQLALGAAVGELVLGKQVGRKAALWGAVFGTVPDLDVLVNPWLSDIQQLEFHRSITHSLFFSVAMAPVGGYLVAAVHRHSGVGWRAWAWLVFWCLFTHIVLDCFTTYGTQILQPFSDYRLILGTIFIIDPLYTLPLLFGLLFAFRFRRNIRLRRFANGLGLGLSSAYLLFTLGNKLYVDSIFATALHEQGLEYRRMFTSPTALNNLLWVALAEDDTGYWVGHYSLLDSDKQVDFRHFDARRELLAELHEGPVMERLRWFTSGYYALDEIDGALYFYDLHLPRTDNWLSMDGDFVFRFRLIIDPDVAGEVIAVHQERPPYGFSREAWTGLLARAWAQSPPGRTHAVGDRLGTAE